MSAAEAPLTTFEIACSRGDTHCPGINNQRCQRCVHAQECYERFNRNHGSREYAQQFTSFCEPRRALIRAAWKDEEMKVNSMCIPRIAKSLEDIALTLKYIMHNQDKKALSDTIDGMLALMPQKPIPAASASGSAAGL